MNSWMRVAVGLLSAAWALAGAAVAQENLDAGKSGAQLYQSNCAICHKSAQALNKSGGGLFGRESFLREHYTSSREAAAAINAYLNSVGGGPADHRPAKKKVRTEKKKDAKPDAKDGVKDGAKGEKPPEIKPDEKKTDEKKPQEKSGEKPAKPDRKEGGKAARLNAAAVRG